VCVLRDDRAAENSTTITPGRNWIIISTAGETDKINEQINKECTITNQSYEEEKYIGLHNTKYPLQGLYKNAKVRVRRNL
jgi:hypothetical protein